MTVSPIGGNFVVALNPSMASAIQDRTLQRVFHDAFFPRLLWPSEAAPEQFMNNLGQTMTYTRTGTIAPTTRPTPANQDPTPSNYGAEQWEATALQYSGSSDTHMPTSNVSLASTYLRNMHTLGLHAGQSKGRIARDSLFNSYTAGTTHVSTTTGAGTSVPVRRLNGFTKKLLNGRPAAINNSTNPLDITIVIAGVPTAFQATGFAMSEGDELFSGTLTVTPAHAGITAGDPVFASNRSEQIQSGGSTTIDGIGAGDRLTLSDCRAGLAQLRANNVPPHETGKYNVHLGPIGEAQLFDDPEFRQIYQGNLPESTPYKEMAIGELGGMLFLRNNETPTVSTCDLNPQRGKTFAAPLTNTPLVGTALEIQRVIITGGSALEEKYMDESKYISEAGLMGKVGEFAVVNQGMQVMTERVRLILRAAMDRLQQQVSTSWSWSGAYVTPSNETSPTSRSTLSSYRAAVVVNHASS